MDHSKKKYYIILAVNPNDPEDIIGFVEHSFSMGWEKGRVVVWEASHERGEDEYKGTPAKKRFNEKLRSGAYGFYDGSNAVKGRKTMLRKQIADPASKEFSCCGRTHSEYMWNWVRHYSMWCGKELRKKGYEIRPYRVGSKFCPVELDFTERTAMSKKQIPYNKYNWRNVPYKNKKLID